MSMDYVNLVTSVLGAVGTFSGFTSWYFERRARAKVLVENKRRIWTDISKVRGLMSDLEKDEGESKNGEGRLQAVGKLTFMLRDLLREACLIEKNMSVETVVKWRQVGKLASDWQFQLALNMLQADEIDLDTLSKHAINYGKQDELPSDHACHAGGFLQPDRYNVTKIAN